MILHSRICNLIYSTHLSVRVDAAGAADVEGAEAESAVDLEVVVDLPLGRAEYPV